MFIERTDADAETPIFWPPDEKNWLTGKDPDAWKDLRQKVEGTTEDEMVGWHHLVNGHEWELVMDKETCHVEVHGVTKSQAWLNDWTELNGTELNETLWKVKVVLRRKTKQGVLYTLISNYVIKL